MNSNRHWFSPRVISVLVLLAGTLLLPAPAQEGARPAAADKPAPAATPTAPAATPAPAGAAAAADDAEAPPDLGENVSADNSVSFPVDI
jgi:hypothetical protein